MESRNRSRSHHREVTMTDQFQLTDDQLAIQDMARKFTADRITPFAAEWDEKHQYPVDVWKAAGELGFGAIYVADESGGIGLGRLEAALIMGAMAYGCPPTTVGRAPWRGRGCQKGWPSVVAV